jgi:hypothetical protein
LEHNRITRLLLEGESKRSEGLMELPVREKLHPLIVVIDPILLIATTKKLFPN